MTEVAPRYKIRYLTQALTSDCDDLLLTTKTTMFLARTIHGNISIAHIRQCLVRCFTSQFALWESPLPPRIKIIESDITEAFLKGSGPGGQKINKTSSAVQLKHLPTGIVVKCQETRSRAQNRKLARRILGDRLEELEKGPQSRTALKAERERKKKASASKKSKRKYRKLEDGSEVEEAVKGDAEATSGAEEVTGRDGVLLPDGKDATVAK
jgi:protein subunit release factor B